MKQVIREAIIGALYLTILLVLWSISYLGVAVVIAVLSVCFGFTFTWKLVFGVWIILKGLYELFRERKRGIKA